MNTSIFIPKRINVGYQERSDTYTGKLAYVIYFDEKGVLRKQKSWDEWRDEDIPNVEFDNVPTEGFVLNKRIGGSSGGWDQRQAYCRVYDPRGFEFEITIDNLLYILENTSSIKGKGLEGTFVYGWSGTELILIPTSSPDYKTFVEYSENVSNAENIRAKDLVLGARYLMKNGDEVVYMGKRDYGYEIKENPDIDFFEWCDGGQRFWFAKKNLYGGYKFEQLKTISKGKIIKCLDANTTLEYSEIYENMIKNPKYGPCDSSKNRFVRYSFEEFPTHELINNSDKWLQYFYVLIEQKNNFKEVSFSYNRNRTAHFYIGNEAIDMSIRDFYEKYKPGYIEKYLPDGTFYAKCNRLCN